MKKAPIWLLITLAILYTLYIPIFFPSIRFAFFAPLLAIAFHRIDFIRSLWLCFLCGGFIDLFSSQMKFGLYALSFCLATCVCYKQKRHFFEEKSIALSLFSILISSIQSLCLIFVSAIFDKQVSISLSMMISEIIITPMIDGIYAFIGFLIPMKLYLYILSGKWKAYFQNQEES